MNNYKKAIQHIDERFHSAMVFKRSTVNEVINAIKYGSEQFRKSNLISNATWLRAIDDYRAAAVKAYTTRII